MRYVSVYMQYMVYMVYMVYIWCIYSVYMVYNYVYYCMCIYIPDTFASMYPNIDAPMTITNIFSTLSDVLMG
jgi:hypothetical protein